MPLKEFFGQMMFSILGGGSVAPLTMLEFMNYGGNYGCFGLSGGYETCSQIGLYGGVIVGSLFGFFVWRYSARMQSYFLKLRWFHVIGAYFCSVCLWLLVIFNRSLMSTDPEQWAFVGIAIVFFIFCSALSLIPFLVYKGVQKLFAKK